MNMKIAYTVLITFLSFAGFAAGKPDKANITGWRGDGSGRYPDANPPVHWSKTSKIMLGLSCQAEKPNSKAEKGKSDLSGGIIKEWLVLGPFEAGEVDKKDPFANFAIKGKAELDPAPGDETNGKTWRQVKYDNSFIETDKLFDSNVKGKGGYLYVNIYSETNCKVWFNIRGRRNYEIVQFTLNGVTKKRQGLTCPVKKGWNRLLISFVSLKKADEADKGTSIRRKWQPMVGVMLWGNDEKNEYEDKNIIWQSRLPLDAKTKKWGDWIRFSSASQPVIVGDKIFAASELSSLICFDKNTGKKLWMRTDNWTDIATPEERKKKARLFAEIDPWAKRLKEIDKIVSSRELTPDEIYGKNQAGKDIMKLMFKVNPKKYYRLNAQEGGVTCPTPITDGKRIYMYYSGIGMVVCYDLKGNRLWIDHYRAPPSHHCYAASPCLVDNILILVGSKDSLSSQNDKKMNLMAYSADKGKLLWRKNIPVNAYGSPVVARFQGRKVIVLTNGALYDPKSGDEIYSSRLRKGWSVTPVVFGNKVIVGNNFWNKWYPFPLKMLDFANTDLTKPKITTISFPTKDYWQKYLVRGGDSLFFLGSPLYHDGLIYYYRADGLLVVADAKTMNTVYIKDLGTNWWLDRERGEDSASLTLAGKYIYYFDIGGTCIVFEPGRTYKEVARNWIEQTHAWSGYVDNYKSTPIFEGNRLYFKSSNWLYCIGGK